MRALGLSENRFELRYQFLSRHLFILPFIFRTKRPALFESRRSCPNLFYRIRVFYPDGQTEFSAPMPAILETKPCNLNIVRCRQRGAIAGQAQDLKLQWELLASFFES